MHKLCVFFFLVCSALSNASASDALDTTLQQRPIQHPSIMLDEHSLERMRSAIATSPAYQDAYQHLISSTDAMCKLPAVTREMKGRRMLHSSRTALRRILHAGVAHLLTGEERYLQLGKRTALAAAAFKDWNPNHFLDVAEMCCALGIAYDWFYHQLSDDEKHLIRSALVDKGLKQVNESAWWISTNNNWNQVCHAGLSIAALAIREQHPDLAKQTLSRAIQKIPIAMHVYEPDGAYPEGAGYWIYGSTYNIFLIDALQSCLGNAFALDQHKAFYKSAGFFRQSFGPSGLICNYADCSTGKGLDVNAAPFWFTRELGNGLYSQQQLQSMNAYINKQHNLSNSSDRFFPLIFVWASASASAPTQQESHEESLSWHGDGHTAVSFLRSSWDDNSASFLMLKGGSPSDNHAHMDVGSFIFDAKGKRWAADLGKEHYGTLEAQKLNIWNRKQSSDRWNIFRHASASHNILMVDKQNQHVSGRGAFIKKRLTGDGRFSIIDLSSVYAEQLHTAQRGVQLFNNGVAIIQDEIRSAATSPIQAIRWAMCTQAQITLLNEQQTAQLQHGDESYFVHLESSHATTWSIQDCTPTTAFEKQNQDYQLLCFEIALASADKAGFRVIFTPTADAVLPNNVTLSHWK